MRHAEIHVSYDPATLSRVWPACKNESFDTSIISKSAHIIRDFIEDYHKRNEEHFVPRFRQAAKLVGLVDVLYQQHQAGRRLTGTILHLVPMSATPGDERHRLVYTLQAFIRMYRPHEVREDTVLFSRAEKRCFAE